MGAQDMISFGINYYRHPNTLQIISPLYITDKRSHISYSHECFLIQAFEVERIRKWHLDCHFIFNHLY